MKYRVTVPFAAFVTIEVEAEDKEEAREQAVGEIYISGYYGGGGAGKLIGVTEGIIEAGDTPIEDGGFKIEVHEA